jgi:hypothetical protein
MPKKEKRIMEVTLVEVTKVGSEETKRVVDGFSGISITDEAVGGVWKARRLKIPCPECHGCHTSIELSIQELGWEELRLSKSDGIMDFLGNFDIYCDDCKKLFTYSPSGEIRLDFVEEMPYDEKQEKAKKEGKELK